MISGGGLERFNVAQFDDVAEARAAGVGEEYLGLYAHANLWPADDPGPRQTALAYAADGAGVHGGVPGAGRADARAACRALRAE